MIRSSSILLFLTFRLFASADELYVIHGRGFVYTRLGNPDNATSNPESGFFLGGGGRDPDEAFTWLCTKAHGGDFLVLRTMAFDDYTHYLRRLCPSANSIGTLILSADGARDPFVAETIRHASALFIPGGDQAFYLSYWLGTPVQTEINRLIARGIPFGGTSAGLHVLPQFTYSDVNGDVRSGQALLNPFDHQVVLLHDFLEVPLLQGVVADAHLRARDRIGRAIVFLARLAQEDLTRTVSGIFLDEKTALLVEPDGRARLTGSGSVYFMRAIDKPEICEPGQPLTFRNVSVYRISEGGEFNLKSWTGNSGLAYAITVERGVITSTQRNSELY